MAKMKGKYRPEVQNSGVNIDKIEQREFDREIEEALTEREESNGFRNQSPQDAVRDR